MNDKTLKIFSSEGVLISELTETDFNALREAFEKNKKKFKLKISQELGFCQCCKLPQQIKCHRCQVEKSTFNFHKGKKICKSCRSEDQKQKYIERKAKQK